MRVFELLMRIKHNPDFRVVVTNRGRRIGCQNPHRVVFKKKKKINK